MLNVSAVFKLGKAWQ